MGNELEKENAIVGKNVVVYKKDSFIKTGHVISVDKIFLTLRFKGSGSIQAIPLGEVDHLKIIENEVDSDKYGTKNK